MNIHRHIRLKLGIVFLALLLATMPLSARAVPVDSIVPQNPDTIGARMYSANAAEEDAASPLQTNLPLSPQAAALARYGEYPVSHATGVPDITIPLYEIRLGSFTLPVSLSYHAS